MSFAATGAWESFAYGRLTQTAGTVISRLIPPKPNVRTKITKLLYTCAGTAHTITIMRPLGRTTVAVAAAAAATSLVLTRDPGDYTKDFQGNAKLFTPSVANNLVAANDYFVIGKPDGTFLVTTCSAATTAADTGRVTLTVAALPTGGIAANAPVWFLGVLADTDPNTNEAHQTLLQVVSVVNTWDGGQGCVAQTFNMNEPILLQSSNATAAGSFDYVTGIYGP